MLANQITAFTVDVDHLPKYGAARHRLLPLHNYFIKGLCRPAAFPIVCFVLANFVQADIRKAVQRKSLALRKACRVKLFSEISLRLKKCSSTSEPIMFLYLHLIFC